MYDNNVNSIDAIHASVLLECIHMRNNTSQCNSLNYEEANDIIDYFALSWVTSTLTHKYAHAHCFAVRIT